MQRCKHNYDVDPFAVFRFKRAEGTDGFLYSYNPCYGFNEGACGNAAVR